MADWTAEDVPDQTGRRVIVTGANSGIGRRAAEVLAARGADVTLACRDLAKAQEAAEGMEGTVTVRRLDLADLDSVRAFAAETEGPVDLLVNNAGIMAPPLKRTRQGFELQLGTNHLGHFALTGLLLDRLLAADDPRVVTVSSVAHRVGRIAFDDLQADRGYDRWRRYGQSKLANLLFMFELQRRAGDALLSVAAHPGYASTHLQSHTESFQDQVMGVLNRIVAQSDRAGAWPTLYAATEDVPPAAYVGPKGPGEMRGHPGLVGCSKAARDEEVARRLWERSEELTGVSFALPALA